MDARPAGAQGGLALGGLARRQQRMRYGVAIVPTARQNVVRNAFTDTRGDRCRAPPAGFQRVAVGRYYAAYVRCPPGSPAGPQ